jgi:hypothetical protein
MSRALAFRRERKGSVSVSAGTVDMTAHVESAGAVIFATAEM